MDNSQDFYKMDKICISIYPDFAAHVLSFCCLPDDEGLSLGFGFGLDFADIAVAAAPPRHSPGELHHHVRPQ